MDDQSQLQTEQKAEEASVVVPETPVEEASDKLTPDHPRFKQVLDRAKTAEEKAEALERRLSELEGQVSQRQQATGDETLTAEEEIALNRVSKLLEKQGFARRADVEANERITKRALQLDKLEGRYDGSNGYPKFDPVEVVEYARRNGYSDQDLDKAYKNLHMDAIIAVEARKRSAPQPTESEKPSGSSRQLTPQLTVEDIPNLSDQDYEKNRSTILERLRGAARQASRFE